MGESSSINERNSTYQQDDEEAVSALVRLMCFAGRLFGSMLQVMPLILHYPVHSACHRLRLVERARQQQTAAETVRDFVCSPHMLASECFCQVVYVASCGNVSIRIVHC